MATATRVRLGAAAVLQRRGMVWHRSRSGSGDWQSCVLAKGGDRPACNRRVLWWDRASGVNPCHAGVPLPCEAKRLCPESAGRGRQACRARAGNEMPRGRERLPRMPDNVDSGKKLCRNWATLESGIFACFMADSSSKRLA